MKPASHIQNMDLEPVELPLGDEIRTFDIADPELPDWIEDAELSAGDYPYDKKLDRSEYEDTLESLQAELVKLHAHMQRTGERLIVLFEGRDAAGKGGAIGRFRANLNPRRARVVALPKPTETEAGQWYFQRYVVHMPTAGDIVLFDRSWYNRAVVEPVMGFCSDSEYESFMEAVNPFEAQLAADGIRVVKIWLNIGRETQLVRFHDRLHIPLKYWKFSSIDMRGIALWDRYTHFRDRMLRKTHTDDAPWTVIRANDKRRARIETIRRVLLNTDYEGRNADAIGEPDGQVVLDADRFLSEEAGA